MSLKQLAENRQATALSEGVSYLVHVCLERIHGMPTVKGSLEDKYVRAPPSLPTLPPSLSPFVVPVRVWCDSPV
jgi:hypothetical protein